MRTINISQKEVAAMRAYKTDIKTMADHFGITPKEMRDAIIKFGFIKPSKNSTDYLINLDFDFPMNRVNNIGAVRNDVQNFNDNVTTEYSPVDDAFVNTVG